MPYARTVALAIAASSGLIAAHAHAQPDERAIRDLLRDCARLPDVPARVACYDAIPTADESEGSTVPANPAATFGSNRLPRERGPKGEAVDAFQAKVLEAVEREPGIHLLTLEDGAQWQFVEGVMRSYEAPRRGSSVEIRGASLGSFLLRYRGQPAVRIRRVR